MLPTLFTKNRILGVERKKIYYVGAALDCTSSAVLGSPNKPLHITLIYSHFWFPYKPDKGLYPLTLTDGFTFDKFNDIHVLRITSEDLTNRHKTFLTGGASWDYPDYKPHVSLPNKMEFFPPAITLTGEYYMTWEEV